jgi:hypothetical protein
MSFLAEKLLQVALKIAAIQDAFKQAGTLAAAAAAATATSTAPTQCETAMSPKDEIVATRDEVANLEFQSQVLYITPIQSFIII